MALHIWFQLTTHFIDPGRMKGCVGLVGWPIADGLPTLAVTHQLQVERRTGKVRRRETDVLPLCHAKLIGTRNKSEVDVGVYVRRSGRSCRWWGRFRRAWCVRTWGRSWSDRWSRRERRWRGSSRRRASRSDDARSRRLPSLCRRSPRTAHTHTPV